VWSEAYNHNHSFIVLTIVNANVNYDRKTFIVQATELLFVIRQLSTKMLLKPLLIMTLLIITILIKLNTGDITYNGVTSS
jgi:hypothetical protein